MNRIERVVYDVLKDRVGLKNAVKWAYQRLFSLLPGPRTDTTLEVTERRGAFFGFHDKSPWSADGEMLLGHTFNGDGTGDHWTRGDPVQISVFSGPDWTERTRVAQTRAWNWQQGSQLQWLGQGRRIVFNDFRDGTCVGVVKDLATGNETLLDHAVAATSSGGDRYASICFDTFGRGMPAYGYAFGAAGASSTVAPRKLVVRDLDDGFTLRVGLSDLSSGLRPGDGVEEVDFFSHCKFSPDGSRLLFLRRQSRPNRRLRSEMFCVEMESSSVHRIEFGNMVSHFTWLSNDRVLAYANTTARGDGFYVADPLTGAVSECTSRFNDQDGHPHATPDGERVVFDTYPDRRRYQKLYLLQGDAEQPERLGTFYSPIKFWGDARIDLHPRLRADGRYTCFEAGYNGTRSLVTARLPQ